MGASGVLIYESGGSGKVAMKVGDLTLPDFMIVGAQKAGTTTLASWLSRHPDIGMSRPKEPYFFTAQEFPSPYPGHYIGKEGAEESDWVIRDPDAYSALFDCMAQQAVTGEASTHYLYLWRQAIRNSQVYYGEKARQLRIIIILRDPVARAFSAWMMFARAATEPLPFYEALCAGERRLAEGYAIDYDYVGFSRYADAVQAYKNAFDHVLILRTEDLREDAKGETFPRVCDFLGVPRVQIEAASENVGGLPRNRFVYDLVIGNRALRTLFRGVVPKGPRQAVRRWVDRRLLKRPVLDENLASDCEKFFQDDQARLSQVLDAGNAGHWETSPQLGAKHDR